jgi:hypothetical protein
MRLIYLVLLAGAAFAQSANDQAKDPPADVDKVVRERITAFYTMMVNREFRQAESYVAEDTKDVYYNNAKPRITGFEIKSIEYSENFTRAKAMVYVDEMIQDPAFPTNKPIRFTIPSVWKLENGSWVWSYPRPTQWVTPWANMQVPPAGGAPAKGPGVPPPITTAVALGKVRVDKQAVTLKAGEPGQVTFINLAPGQMNLVLEHLLPGIEAAFDHTSLNENEKAVLTLKAGKDAKDGALGVQVRPTGEMIVIDISVK